MKLGLLLELPVQRENIELAARAEAAGFDSVWAPEFHNHSGPLALAGAALETDSVELGTSIAWAFGRSPLLTAVTALDLDELSGGRFVLGLGTGTRRMRTDWLGAPGDRPATAPSRDGGGDPRRLGGGRSGGGLLRRGAGPPQRPALWPCRAGSPHPSDLSGSGERGDGPDGRSGRRRRRLPPDGDRALHRRGDAARDRGGRPGGGTVPEDVSIADWLLVAVSDDADQAREDAKRQIAFHATVRTYDRILDLHGFTETAAQIRELWRSFDLAAMTALVTDDMLDAMAVAGRPDECRDRVAERAASVDRLLLGAPVVATDAGLMREYHDAIVETFGHDDSMD